ncbi:FKBP-type peptidyl-prolyl cis-trans isomerase [Aeromicrobium sp. CF3.5]|uniref:FKBP-type peptidyl-prolyl cis-trans isomerase n=1 Tax=Aeromicrobium sp. CF3.5 TaxID=3373078 RepID=UPI003EE70297
MLRILIACVSAALVLSGCGSDDDSVDAAFESIEITGGATPKVTVPEGFSSASTETKIVKAGGGETVEDGDTVKVNYLAVNGRTGEQFDSSYASGQAATFTLDESSLLPGFIKALGEQKIGSRILVAIAPEDGFGQARAELDLKADDTMVFLFDLVADVPDEAQGTEKELPSDVPQITLDDDDHPSGFKPSDDVAPDPTAPSVNVAIEGDGPVIEPGQNVVTQYVGQIYPDGEVFDSSWDRGMPAPFQMVDGGAISCFTDQIPGQKVGSRILLICPPDSAYGAEGRPPTIEGDQTLMFAVDLLDAS